MADEEGFEPPIPLRVYRISSAARSTTLPLIRIALLCIMAVVLAAKDVPQKIQ